MNPFINPRQRDVSLPAGCKDLIDVLEVSHDLKTAATEVGFVITACLPGLRKGDVEITVGGDTVRIIVKKADTDAPSVSVVRVPAGYCISDGRAVYSNGELRITIPKSAA